MSVLALREVFRCDPDHCGEIDRSLSQSLSQKAQFFTAQVALLGNDRARDPFQQLVQGWYVRGLCATNFAFAVFDPG